MLENSIIVGRSAFGNEATLKSHINSRAIILPRTEGFAVKNISMHNFGSGMILVESASENDNGLLLVTGGKYTGRLSGIRKVQCQDARVVKWVGPRTNMFEDVDGSLTGKGIKTYLAPFNGQFIGVEGCVREVSNIYDDSIVCSAPGLDLRNYLFRNLQPEVSFKSIPMKMFNVNNGITSF